jgi:hypothetical protein
MEKCEDGQPFLVTIVDPCFNTEILADIFVDQMARPQLQSAELNLRDQIPFGRWPWQIQLDIDTDPVYGSTLCGNMIYKIMTDEPVPQDTNLVTKDGDWLTFAPDLSYSPNTYDLILVAYLEQYGMINAKKAFSVVVLPCEADLVSIGA